MSPWLQAACQHHECMMQRRRRRWPANTAAGVVWMAQDVPIIRTTPRHHLQNKHVRGADRTVIRCPRTWNLLSLITQVYTCMCVLKGEVPACFISYISRIRRFHACAACMCYVWVCQGWGSLLHAFHMNFHMNLLQFACLNSHVCEPRATAHTHDFMYLCKIQRSMAYMV